MILLLKRRTDALVVKERVIDHDVAFDALDAARRQLGGELPQVLGRQRRIAIAAQVQRLVFAAVRSALTVQRGLEAILRTQQRQGRRSGKELDVAGDVKRLLRCFAVQGSARVHIQHCNGNLGATGQHSSDDLLDAGL